MPNLSFILNGERVSVDAPDDLGLLYVLRDKLGVTTSRSAGTASRGRS